MTEETAVYRELLLDEHHAALDYYVSLAAEEGEQVALLGPGCGRLALPIAEACLGVLVVEPSPARVARLRALASLEPDRVARRVEIGEGDPSRLGLSTRFRQVFLPGGALQSFLTVADRHRCLETAWSLLEPGGRLALDVSHPEPLVFAVRDSELEGAWRERGPVSLPEGGAVRVQIRLRHDLLNKRLSRRLRWLVQAPDGDRILEESDELCYLFRDELLLHLERAGFVVEQIFGDFQRHPLEKPSQRMVVVARKRV